MSANLENLAVATGLEKVCLHSNSKEGQCQRMFQLPYNCTHSLLARLFSNFFKSDFSSMWTKNFQMYKLGFEEAQEPEIKLSTLDHRKIKINPEKHLCLLYWLCWILWPHIKLWKNFKAMRVPDHLTCLLRKLYAAQEETVRIRHGTTDWSKLG